MNWIDQLNEALKHIEINILEDIDLNELGRIAGCTGYQFQRMFTYIANYTLAEYIRNRRLSLAVADLQSGKEKVIDIALKYGYSSPTAFNRAFQKLHGIAPSQVKEEGIQLKSFLPISFKLTIRGVEEMNYRIEKKDAFRIIGTTVKIYNDMEKNMSIIPGVWDRVCQDGTIEQLCKIMNQEPMGLLGVSVCHVEDDWKYFIAVASDQKDDAFEAYTIPASIWAIFSGEGSSVTIQELLKRIWTEWLPNSGYEYDKNSCDLEVYLTPDSANAKYEVWFPIVKK